MVESVGLAYRLLVAPSRARELKCFLDNLVHPLHESRPHGRVS